jgi:hypothetical protein
MSCWLFFIVMWSRGADVPPACEEYSDDPGYSEVVHLPRYIEEDEIDSNGDGYWAVDA